MHANASIAMIRPREEEAYEEASVLRHLQKGRRPKRIRAPLIMTLHYRTAIAERHEFQPRHKEKDNCTFKIVLQVVRCLRA